MTTRKITRQAVDFILTRKIEELADLNGTKIARALAVKPYYLAQKFKEDQNITLRRFIIREKLHRAIFLLEKNKKLSTIDLAKKLGFSKPGHFDTEFYRYFAIEPSQFQNLLT